MRFHDGGSTPPLLYKILSAASAHGLLFSPFFSRFLLASFLPGAPPVRSDPPTIQPHLPGQMLKGQVMQQGIYVFLGVLQGRQLFGQQMIPLSPGAGHTSQWKFSFSSNSTGHGWVTVLRTLQFFVSDMSGMSENAIFSTY